MYTLTVRSARIGEQVAPRVREVTRDDRLSATRVKRIIIFVHGFSVNENGARKAYHEEMNALRVALAYREMSRLGEFVAFHWPGDHPDPLVSKMTFSARPPDAILSGERLVEYFERLPVSPEIVIIAHSLGCQVTLAALARIRDRIDLNQETGREYRPPRITKVFLMAPAIQLEACRENGPYGVLTCEEQIFFSKYDTTLKYAFEPGGYLYNGVKSQAVGYLGLPYRRWSDRHEKRLNHGQYWGNTKVAGDIVRSLMGEPAAELSSRTAGTERSTAKPWSLPTGIELPMRS